ncbi:MAG TPA: NAD(P)/FAD-dependent oxidoreductase [Solirubrobacteraceae bacterium]|nr:NAD(P)/FAD-dependent oxidoreductase [Solirubrobacteraceae bacterium]
MRTFDVVVVGGGPSGEEAAGRLADAGLHVAVVEGRLIGGECAHWACIPSKALLRPPEALAETRRIPGARESLNGGPNVAAVLARRDEVIGMDQRTGKPGDAQLTPWLDKHGVTLVRGRARLVGERRVATHSEELEARRAVILAAGSEPLIPPIEGLARLGGVWTNTEATTTEEIPGRLVIVGAGPVGVEMAQAFQKLGSQVTLIEGEARVLPTHEEFACVQVTEALRAYGVEVRTGQRAIHFDRNGEAYSVTTSGGEQVQGDVVLVALGRKAPTDDIGLEVVGLNPGGYLIVDRHMRVQDVPWLYAIGDVNGRAMFTHMGKYQARIAVDCILGNRTGITHGADGSQAPSVIFTDPQVASVGHTTETATAAGIDFDAYDTQTSGNAGGLFYGPNAPGTARFVVDRDRRVLIGCTITGSEVADFIHAATIAVVGEVPLERLRHAVPPFPTRSEIWLSLLLQAGV